MSNFKSRLTTTHIVIHCSATPEGKPFTAKDIDRWHREKGWQGIGYHFVVELDGKVTAGRPLGAVGSHVAGQNTTSLGICYIGGLTADNTKAKDTRTQAQKDSLLVVIKNLRDMYPNAVVQGHRDFKGVAKDCPSFNAKKEYAAI